MGVVGDPVSRANVLGARASAASYEVRYLDEMGGTPDN